MKRLELLLHSIVALLVAVGTMLVVAQTGRTLSKREVPTELVEATILEVEERPTPFDDGRTLVELEDGTRRILSDVYGEPGDRFMLRTRR